MRRCAESPEAQVSGRAGTAHMKDALARVVGSPKKRMGCFRIRGHRSWFGDAQKIENTQLQVIYRGLVR